MEPASVIPENVRALIQVANPTVAAMEALLLLCEHQSRTWTTPELAQRLYITEAEAQASADVLSKAGLFGVEAQAYRYQPGTEELGQAVEELKICYKTRLIPLTRLIHARAPKSDIQQFADVFRLRKDP